MIRQILILGAALGFGQAADAATTNYWNLFNIEGENQRDALYATYGTLSDMLRDENRTGSGVPDGESIGQFAPNIVGSGAYVPQDDMTPIPLPASAWLLAIGLGGLFTLRGDTQRSRAA